MQPNIRTLEVFNTLETFKRREYKLLRKSLGYLAVTTSVVIGSLVLLPESVGIVPCAVIGIPSTILGIKNAYEADKVSSLVDCILSENKNKIINFKINSSEEKKEFTEQFPILTKTTNIFR